MNQWLQRKLYRCPACGLTYVHDRAFYHASYDCPGRQPTSAPKGARTQASYCCSLPQPDREGAL